MDLEVLIARVAVLRTEERAADTARRDANNAHSQALANFNEAEALLQAEIDRRVNALDPDAG